MKLCIVQAVLPLYAIAFFNKIVELNSDIDLVVLADIKTQHPLNQFHPQNSRFRVVQLDNVELKGVSIRPRILKVLRNESPDIVVFSGSVRDLSQFVTMFSFRLLGKPFAVWGMFHRIGPPRMLTNIYFRIVGFLSNVCFAYTRTGATNLVRLGVNKKKVVVVGTAIDESLPKAEISLKTPEDLRKFKHDMNLEDKQIVLQVVRLSKVKRPELLVYAAAELLRKRDDVVFVIVGDGEMRQEIKALIASLGLSDSFKMLGAIYDEKLLSYWYLSASVFVVPTFIGLSAQHAMAYGVPIVTDDSLDCQGSEFDILANGLNALLYKEGDAGDMAVVLNRLLSDIELRGQLSANAKLTVERVHNLTNKTHQFVSHVESLAKLVQT